MTITNRTTELEAVNTILSTVGEAPLNTLIGSLPVDGTIAKNVLNEINREMQSQGWHFNTHYKATLSKDANNKIPVANNVLRVDLDPNKYSKASFDIVQRNNFMYNLATNLDTFTQDFEDVTIVYLLDFSDLPEQARRYATIRSARVFHDRTLGATTLHKYSQEDEARALIVLKQAEASTGDYTIFDNGLGAYTVSRTNVVY